MTPQKTSEELDSKILSFIQQGENQPHDDVVFNKIASELFEYQFVHNKPYQRYCKSLKITPNKIKTWKEIPSVPTSAFKETTLACFPPQKARKVFYTSGTTQQRRGRHYLENLTLYENSLLINFKTHFGIGQGRWPLVILTPSPQEAPHSSLCHMMGVLQEEIGTEENSYFIQKGQFLMEGLKKRLKKLCSLDQPAIILGTAFSFVHFLDDATQNKWRVQLPAESRIMETGGYKEKSRELSKQELYQLIHKVLGVPKAYIINEYGMTEMGSQFYDNTLKNLIEFRKGKERAELTGTRASSLGKRLTAGWASMGKTPSGGLGGFRSSFCRREERRSRGESFPLANINIYKTIPPWVRTRVLNPPTLEELPPNQMGLLQHYDLANRSSVMALLTEDIGVKIEDGFEILGRAPAAEPRGCSIGVEEWIYR